MVGFKNYQRVQRKLEEKRITNIRKEDKMSTKLGTFLVGVSFGFIAIAGYVFYDEYRKSLAW